MILAGHSLVSLLSAVGFCGLLGSAAAFAIAGRAADVRFFGNHPAVVLALGLAACAGLALSMSMGPAWRTWRRDISVLSWLAGSYAFAWALAGWLLAETGESWSTRVVFLVAGNLHVPILAALTLLTVTAMSFVAEPRHRGVRLLVGVLAVASIASNTVWGEGFGPFADIPPLTDGNTVTEVVTGLAGLAFLLTTALPILLAIRLTRTESGEPRRRLAIVSCAALVTVALVQMCTLAGLAASRGGASSDAATAFLFVGLALAVAAAAGLNTLALRTPLGLHGQRLARLITALLTSIAVLTAIPVGILISGAGPGAGLLGAAGAVLAMAVFQPIQQRTARALVDEEPTEEKGAISSPSVTIALTPREIEVIRLLSEGLSNSGIASRLVLSERTVDAHLRAIFSKLELPDSSDVNRRVHAVLVWRRAVHEAGSPILAQIGENADAPRATA